MIVRLTVEAEHDLESIGDYIAHEDPERAVAFIRTLRSKCMELADFPARFPTIGGLEPGNVRRRVHGSYLILYRVDDASVIILHIVHGARDYADLLQGRLTNPVAPLTS